MVRDHMEEQVTAEPAMADTDNGTVTSHELQPWRPAPVMVHNRDRDIVDGWVEHAASVFRLAEYIAPTEFVPRTMRNKPAAVAACILAGRELDLGPMTSLRHVQVVEGSPSLSAEYKRARVLERGHQFDVLELNTTRCRVRGRRRGAAEDLEVSYSIDDARRAGLVKPRGAWDTRPRRMLLARASSELCDFLFSDCVNGLPTTELLEAGGEYPEIVTNPAETADTTERTVSRKTSTGTRARKGGSPVAKTDRAPEPPLPGEEPETHHAVITEPAPPDVASGIDREAIPPNRIVEDEAPAPDGPPADVGTEAMVKAIQSNFKNFGITSRDDKLRVVSALAGRAVASSKELTPEECHAALDAMTRAGQAPTTEERGSRLWVIVNAWEASQTRGDDE